MDLPEIRLKGFDALERRLIAMDALAADHALRESLLDGAEPIRVYAAQLAPKKTGNLARSIVTRIRNRKRAGFMVARIGVLRQGSHAILVEFGTAPHDIVPTTKQALTIGAGSGGPIAIRPGAHHPGTRKQPFMRPALDARGAEAVQVFGASLFARITKAGG